MKSLRTPFLLCCGALGIATLAYGTNGMNMEGYGPRSAALGGASTALDTGTAATVNNPATLTLQKRDARMDVYLGRLGPDVKAIMPGAGEAKSASDAFYMPALGYTRRDGNQVWGLALFGQGGMGTKYSASSFMGLGRDLDSMTEVSVGRLMAPYAVKVNDKLGIGGSLDLVWAGMDLCMAMSGEQLMDLANPASQRSGRAEGSLLQALSGATPEFAYFDFHNDNSFTGEATGYGYAANLGVVYDLSPEFRLGAVYHSPTWLEDLDTNAATVKVGATSPMGYAEMALAGDVSVIDFQWPATYAVGLDFRPTARWSLVADVKRIQWSEVMDSFRMRFVAKDTASNGPMAGLDLVAELYQRWSDQTVYSLGTEYVTSEYGTYRFGFNHASNPIPAQFLNPLFPATVEDHVTIGGEHRLGRAGALLWSVTKGLKKSVTNSAWGMTSEHEQLNFQIMYSRFWGE